MARITPLDVHNAEPRSRELLDELASRGTEPGPMVRAMANAPALLRGYVELSRAMKRSHLDRRVSERISLAVQEWLGCGYCVEAHSRAARALGLSETDIELARQGTATDPRSPRWWRSASRCSPLRRRSPTSRYRSCAHRATRDEQIAEVPGLVALQRHDRRVQPRCRHPPGPEREERRMSNPYTAWAAAVGAAGCGRCATAA